MNAKRLASDLSALLFDNDQAALEARLQEWQANATTHAEREVLARLADHALGLKPMLDGGTLTREELQEALELMLHLARDGGRGVG